MYVITPTGDRPDAFALCQKYMVAQDYIGPVRWIVVDDGETPVEVNREGWDVTVLHPYHSVGNTQSRNLLVGMGYVPMGERLVIVEDDDAYAPGYLSAVSQWLDSADLVGERNTRYYNVRTGKGQRMKNRDHASLCSTAMKGLATEVFANLLVDGELQIDIRLWREFQGSKYLSDTTHVTGIKGMGGRPGIGVGHRESFGLPMDLRDWMGDDAGLYAR